MKRYFQWLAESNRIKHLIVGFLIGLTLGFNAALAAAASAEAKDWLWNGQKGGVLGWIRGNGFDWLDLSATLLGGAVGTGARLLIEYFI